jgi:hypothetical protein
MKITWAFVPLFVFIVVRSRGDWSYLSLMVGGGLFSFGTFRLVKMPAGLSSRSLLDASRRSPSRAGCQVLSASTASSFDETLTAALIRPIAEHRAPAS